jgi:hypothetical protein
MKTTQSSNCGTVTAAYRLHCGTALGLLMWAIVQCLVLTRVCAQAPPFEWVRQAGGIQHDQAIVIAMDLSGNIFVSGYFSERASFGAIPVGSVGGPPGIFVAKYNSSGVLVWVRGYSNGQTYLNAGIGVDAGGNVYVAGSFYGNQTFGSSTFINNDGGHDSVLLKFDAGGNLAWARQGNSSGGTFPNALTIDQNTNIHLAGTFYGSVSFGTQTLNDAGNGDAFLVSYDSLGNVVRVRKAGGLEYDSANGIATDASNSLFVTGQFNSQVANFSGALATNRLAGYPDIFLAKYDAAGNVLWVRSAGSAVGGGTLGESGNGVAVDSSGNAFVSGCFNGSASFGTNTVTSAGGLDAFIVKYDPDGNAVWVRKAGGPSDDCSFSVAIDNGGNSYVTGEFRGTMSFGSTNLGSVGGKDIFIAKYDPQGNLVWARRAGSAFDEASEGIAVDVFGNTILAGYFYDSTTFDNTHITGAGLNDIFVAKLPAATPVPPTITSQPTNQTVRTGESANFSVAATGTAPLNYQWQFNGTNIAAATNFLLTINNAQPTNAGNYRVVVSNSGGAVTSAVVTLSVTPMHPTQSGAFEWVRDAGGPDYDQGIGIAADGLTNIYVTGSFRGSGLFGNILLTNNYNGSPLDGMFLAKYDSFGTLLWAKGIKNNNVSYGFAVAPDGNGNIYVTGQFIGTASFGATNLVSGAGYDAFLAKYTSAGNVVWVRQGRGESYEGGRAVAVETNGSVHCVGLFGPVVTFENVGLTNAGWNVFHAKFDASGNLLWLRQSVSPVDDEGLDVAVDRAGNSYIAGSVRYDNEVAKFNGILVTNAGIFSSAYLMKRDSGGNPLWVRVSSGGNGYCYGVAIDNGANVYLTGGMQQGLTLGTVTVTNAEQFGNSFIAKCDASGDFIWGKSFGGIGSSVGNAIAVDGVGNTSVAGYFNGTNTFDATNLVSIGDLDIFIARFDPAGNFTWAKQAGSPGADSGRALTLDAAGNVYVTGLFAGNASFDHTNIVSRGADDIFTAKISTNSQVTLPGMLSIFVDGELITNGSVSRLASAEISMLTTFPNGSIFFTLDGSEPSFATSLYEAPFLVNRPVTIRAIAYDASFVNSWEADPVSISIEPTYTVNATAAGGGSISLSSSSGVYSNGALVTLTATPLPGWTFLQWLGDASGTNPTNTVRVTGDLCVQALFGTSLGTTVAGNGSVMIDPVAPLYPYGTVVRLTALPQPGNFFAAWGNAASGTNNPVLFAVTNANPTVSCVFGTLSTGQVALTTVVNGQGRVTTNPRGSRFNTNQTVTLTATPDADQSFVGWSGDASGAATNLVVTMNQNKVVNANFTAKPRLWIGPCYGGARDDGFQFTLTGTVGARYQIESGASLANWAPLTTVTNTFGITQFTDVSATNNTQRFYRVRLAP